MAEEAAVVVMPSGKEWKAGTDSKVVVVMGLKERF